MVAFRRSFSAWMLAPSVFALVCSGPTLGMHGGHGGHSGHAGHVEGSPGFSAVGHANHLNYNPGYFLGGGYLIGGYSNGYAVSAPFVYPGPLTTFGPGGFASTLAPSFPQGFGMGGGFNPGFNPGFNGGLNLPMPPPGFANANANLNLPRPRAANPARSKELTEIGDRSFRARNIKRAEDKYKLAAKADPTSPMPHVHLAQVAVARGNYSAAADHLRDAVTVATDGAWLTNAPDIQAIFGEPVDFARQLARLETHLQANPNDRNAWFVLGAETYLSGRTRQAFDVFQRLTDRRSDEALAAFMDAARPRPLGAN